MPRKTGKTLIAELKRRGRNGIDFAKQTFQTETIHDPQLREAFNYYLTNWENYGHQAIFSVACEAVGGNPNSVIPAQASIALLAAAVDIQDDIIDKSKEKHGIPTLVEKFGPDLSLLVGNAFLIEGLKLFVDSTSKLPKEQGTKGLENLKKLLFDMGNAHALELAFRENKSTSLDDYMRIFKMKAASVEADVYLGALFGGAKASEIEIASRLGRILGTLMMLREEFIDVFELGELAQRIAVQDLPLPIFAAMKEEAAKQKILEIIKKPAKTQADVDTLLDITFKTRIVIETKRYMKSLIKEGISLADKLPQAKSRGILQNLLTFMIEDL